MGVQKLLLPFGGRTVIGHIAGEILHSPVDHTLVVVGRDAARIAAALAGRRVTLVTNPDSGGEMLSSVRCGLRALPPECDAVLVALGDQPTLTAELIGQMIDAFRAAGRGIVVPVCGGRSGHPILFSARYREEVLTRYDAEGLLRLRVDEFNLGRQRRVRAVQGPRRPRPQRPASGIRMTVPSLSC